MEIYTNKSSASTGIPFQAGLAPLGGRGYPSPGLVARPLYPASVWDNPLASASPSTVFPHIPSHRLRSLEQLDTAETEQSPYHHHHGQHSHQQHHGQPREEKLEIYENPSEHYAAIRYTGAETQGSRGSRSAEHTSYIHIV